MPTTLPVLRPRRLAILAALVLLGALLLFLRPLGRALVAQRVRSLAARRELRADWRRLDVGWSGAVRIDGLALTRADHDTVATVETTRLRVAPRSLFAGRPRPGSVAFEHVRIHGTARAAPDSLDVLGEATPATARQPRDRSRRLRRSAEQAVQVLLAPARTLPQVSVTDLEIVSSGADEGLIRALRIERFTVTQAHRATSIAASGTVAAQDSVPFGFEASYSADDRLIGAARLLLPSPRGAARETLAIALDGVVRQDRGRGAVRLGDSTHVTIGALPVRVSGALSRRGPRVTLDLAADGIDQDQVHRSLPPALLGPLLDVAVRGSFDYRLHFDLDLAHPDSVDFHADVIPHGLRLDPARTRLDLLGLDQPFTATIHLPHSLASRRLGPENPNYLPLDRIDPKLAAAVVTNEDGGFFRHRGFNTDAVKASIAENIKAGAYRRGAGTITMQIARNLWLGHQRTLSRKMQEVVLAWILEHLAGLSKQRLLEIYLNIIEWGPGVHGANEATQYYFGHDATRVTPEEALFLATVVPSPTKWRWRFDKNGALRASTRAQMRFIGRAMVAKGWLDPAALANVDSMDVQVRGPARDVLFPEPQSPSMLPTGSPWKPGRSM